MSELPRRMKVLQAIVEDYVASREPVGSKALVDRHDLGVSSATVRNDMADLEDEGLIVAPHTSAGRIPTDKGYRYFVDRISEIRPLSAAEKRAVQAVLDITTDDLDEVMTRSVQVLAQLTHQVAVAQFPKTDTAVIRHLELVWLAEHRLLVAVIFSTGKIEQRMFTVADQEDDLDVQVVRDIFVRQLNGLTAQEALSVIPGILAGVPGTEQRLAEDLSHQLQLLLASTQRDRIYLAGTANLARSQTDFGSSIGPVLEALEEQVVLLKLLAEMQQDVRGLSVSIGTENQGSLSGTSVVAAGYGPNSSSMLGVVGPTRMDYPGTMSAVRAIARYLSKILAQ
ncbi:heat-inducible transcriptional repressor HrcA [Auritidibacter ignavus]|uniref:heat-inducible transcriptional repressor HrcA n=1 Tax=Auritidibacter ignavus TaxID=678932 RepID=UPI00109D25F0|nr:heat-inducible transcriptional repressor HrcA [Auritidibacter ignavus]